jgi:hypothetical protein
MPQKRRALFQDLTFSASLNRRSENIFVESIIERIEIQQRTAACTYGWPL